MFKTIFKNQVVSGNVVISNNTVTIDGKVFSGKEIELRAFVDGIEQPGTFSGTIKIDVVGDCESVKSVSGDINVTGNAGDVKTTSGDITVKGDSSDIKTVSGDVKCKNCTGNIKSVSGTIKTR